MDIVNIITNVGFPIACVIGMGVYVKYLSDNYRKDRDNIANQIMQQVERTDMIIEKNTEMMGRIEVYLDKVSDKDVGN